MCEPIVISRFRESGIRFTVPLPNRAPVYMCANPPHFMRETSVVVLVQTQKFLELWQNDPFCCFKDLAFGSESTWRNDYKFERAEKGFAQGIDNPVPLAQVSCCMQIEEINPSLGFTNGITRTLWLLANECPVFPVECNLPGARQLQELAGMPDTSVLTMEKLLEC